MKESYANGKIALDVWKGGNPRDPLVFVLHDMVGLRQSCFDLGDTLIKEGFSVAIPRFFGNRGGGVLGYVKACEAGGHFHCFDYEDHGPIMPWIKALATLGSGRANFGAIGNCMTGILPLLMLRSRRCVAPVLCQPAFPFNPLLSGPAYRSAVGLPEIDRSFAVLATRRYEIPVLGVRFEDDDLCRPERFNTLRCLLGDRFLSLELMGKGHSTLLDEHGKHLALPTVLGFLKHRLQGGSWDPPPSNMQCQSGGRT